MSDSTSEDQGTNFVTVAISPDPGFTLVFDGLTAKEEIGRPYLIELSLSSGKAKAAIDKMLGASVTVTMIDADKSKAYFNGLVSRANFVGMHGGVYHYHVELRPSLWILSRTRDCKIFQNMSAWDIINKVLKDAGFTETEDKRQNQAGSIVLEYCVQYNESAFDFISRLMEEYGLYFYISHEEGEHKIVFADDPGSHTVQGDPIPFYFGQTEQRAVEDHIWEWSADHHLMPGAQTYRDYNFTTPAADLTAKSLDPGQHPYGSFEVYQYPGRYETVDDGQKLAGVRMQQYKSATQVCTGRSNARRVRVGNKIKLKDTTDPTTSQEYLVTHTEITMTIAEGNSDSRGQLIDSHRVNFSAIPGDVPFRLPSITPRPLIRGPQTAKVVGTSGQEIMTDKYGRIKVKFFWDRDPGADENSSCWIRVAQTWAGAGWGTMFIPRIGMEVVVEFLEGNPDRPIVTGVVYNATQTVPDTLPDNMTRSTIKTNSSQGGGGFNELRFEDKAGSEEVFFQAQKDYHKVVLNNETIEITNDTVTTVKQGKRDITVSQGNNSLTVSQGNDSSTVSAGNHSLSVSAGGSKTTTGQAFEVTAGTSVKLTGTASIELTVGGTSLKLDPSGITMSGPMIKGSGDAMIQLQAAMIQIN
jgi:type VI secretion system secreted protein VgrG